SRRSAAMPQRRLQIQERTAGPHAGSGWGIAVEVSPEAHAWGPGYYVICGTDDRVMSSVTQGLRPAKFHEKVGALHLKPTFWQILGRHMFSMSYTGFSTLSPCTPRQRAPERDIVQMLPVLSSSTTATRPPAADQPPCR